MKVINFPKKLDKQEKTLILGGFESVHKGHITLIEAARGFGKPIVIMLIKDPATLPNSSGKIYASLEHRLEHLATLGIEFAIVIDFDEHIKNMHGDIFIKELMKSTNAVNMVAGKDFRFGKGAKYGPSYLLEQYPGTEIVSIQKMNHKKLATTLLKESVELGDLDFVRTIQGLSFQVETNLAKANSFTFGKQVVPHSGIYSAYLRENNLQHVIAVHVDMQGRAHVKVQNMQSFKKLSKAVIEFHTLVRIITKPSFDHFAENDMNLVIDNLELLYNI